MGTRSGSQGEKKKITSPPVNTSTVLPEQVWAKNGERREVISTNSWGITYRANGVTKEVNRITWHRWANTHYPKRSGTGDPKAVITFDPKSPPVTPDRAHSTDLPAGYSDDQTKVWKPSGDYVNQAATDCDEKVHVEPNKVTVGDRDYVPYFATAKREDRHEHYEDDGEE